MAHRAWSVPVGYCVLLSRHGESYRRSSAMASSARPLVFDECSMLSAVLIRKILHRASEVAAYHVHESGGSLAGRDILSAGFHSQAAPMVHELEYNIANHSGKGLSRL